jgi:Icc-related predicted phosphoesterase
MKILTASDIHQDKKAVKKLASKAAKEKADIVVLAGDITYFDMDWKGMIGPFLEKKKQVLFVPGNHDSLGTAAVLVKKYDIKNLQDYSVVIDDVGFFGCGGANIGLNFIDEEELFETLYRGFKYVKDAKKKVMVTHLHPSPSMTERKSGFDGSPAIRKAIEKFKPDIHIFGHIHETEGLEEEIGNTKSICTGKKGKIVEV